MQILLINIPILLMDTKTRYLNILIWAINFIIKSITRSFIMLNTIMENENTSFANHDLEIMFTALKYSLLKF